MRVFFHSINTKNISSNANKYTPEMFQKCFT